MFDLIIATQCIKKLNENNIPMKKGYFSQLVSSGKIPFHDKPNSTKKFFKYEEVVKALDNIKDPTRDSQREANSKKRDDGIFEESVIPYKSLATMSEEEKKKYNDSLAETMQKLKDMSSEEENNDRPGAGASGQDWNTFKTKQQALNYELDRKMKEGNLMYLDDFKATAEILLGPLNQGLDDLAFNFKSQFPDISDDSIQWLLNRTNQLKVDVQNVSI